MNRHTTRRTGAVLCALALSTTVVACSNEGDGGSTDAAGGSTASSGEAGSAAGRPSWVSESV